MPLPLGAVDRPGTAPDARTFEEFRDVKTVTMRRALDQQRGSRPHTPQIMTIVEPVPARAADHEKPPAMDGYAPPPGRHGDAGFRNAGGRMEGHKLKSERVVVPSTNRTRVNSLLSQAATLDSQALASIGVATGSRSPPASAPIMLGSSSAGFLPPQRQSVHK